jgi:hypothetical protein
MKNKLTDINEILQEQIEVIMYECDDPKKLETEIKRAKGIIPIAKTINNNVSLCLKAVAIAAEYGLQKNEIPDQLQIENKKDK